MTRFDLAFILCCCKACLGSAQEGKSYYEILGVERDATNEELKKAYKKRSLQMHPDKLAQKGKTVTEEDQERFTKMKEAYECLSDPHKRETYDAIGERFMKWMEEPLSVDPQEMAQNFASSSNVDRAKIFGIFVFFALAILIQPILICLQIDGKFGNAKWAAVLVPLWIWNSFTCFYFVRVIMMGEIPRPDHVPEEDWKDPLPMPERITRFVRFLLFFAFEVQLVLHLDGVVRYPWTYVLLPLFLLEASTMFKKFPESRLQIVTVEEIQAELGKQVSELTEAERAAVAAHYIVVNSRTSMEFESAQRHVGGAKREVRSCIFRVVFIALTILKLDDGLNWSWWAVFSPFFIASLCICYSKRQDHAEVTMHVAEKFNKEGAGGNATDYGAMEEGQAANAETSPLSEEEKEELKKQLLRSSSGLLNSCCSQLFFLILLLLILLKIQGAGFSTFWLISPALFVGGIFLCLSGCMIFCVSPMDEEEMGWDGTQFSNGAYYNMNNAVPTATAPTAAAPAAFTAATPTVVPLGNPKPAAAASTPVIVPPAPVTQSDGIRVTAIDEEEVPNKPVPVTTTAEPTVDLLDGIPSDELQDEVIPTPSEVDDLD